MPQAMDKRFIFRYHYRAAQRRSSESRRPFGAGGRYGELVSEGGTQGDSVSVFWL